MTGLWVLLAAIVAATVLGLTLRRRDGRFRPARPGRTAPLPPAPTAPPAGQQPTAAAEPTTGQNPASTGEKPAAQEPAAALAATGPAAGSLAAELSALGRPGGEQATLLQFSTAFCAPCRTTRVVLADVARIVPGVAHIEVDAEEHLDLVRRLGIRRTPTVLVLDADAREISRASGAPPSRAAVIAALGPAAPSGGDLR
ncbi:thioredoxin family protein [Frankia sp. AgB1.9]|uniref:thioredoxin family protein n=1 Tax=unclassified Frankia TaxID=2632575 RepID=UPI00193317DC|nr:MULTISPECIES: thioredoxin family protein [unclassified Frankia]MBL7491227.1 thioredoxin family protein [Frankia sp. AgW1.1]MBL7551578.1 thioredoxin family protein [Frankia sp. AgB1.9]MBL7621715.1 thioredoxin family protein [Frankia sp. AgB1.8]